MKNADMVALFVLGVIAGVACLLNHDPIAVIGFGQLSATLFTTAIIILEIRRKL